MTQPSIVLDSALFYDRPLVYVWKHKEEILYVGMSSIGLSRIGLGHHIVNKSIKVRIDDTFEIYFTNDPIQLEKELILKLKPRYNGRKFDSPSNETKLCKGCGEIFIGLHERFLCGICIERFKLKREKIQRELRLSRIDSSVLNDFTSISYKEPIPYTEDTDSRGWKKSKSGRYFKY